MPHPLLIHDGGTGRELLRRGAPFAQPQWSVLALMQRLSAVADMHRAYIEAGTDIITTNSYALVPFHLSEDDFRTQGDKLATSPENWRNRLSGTAAKNCASPPHCHHHLAPAAPTCLTPRRPRLSPARLLTGRLPMPTCGWPKPKAAPPKSVPCMRWRRTITPSGPPSPSTTSTLQNRHACTVVKASPTLLPPSLTSAPPPTPPLPKPGVPPEPISSAVVAASAPNILLPSPPGATAKPSPNNRNIRKKS